MQVTATDLRNTYEKLETAQLVELRSKGTLTETATAVLAQILAERGVSPTEQQQIETETLEQSNRQKSYYTGLATVWQRALGRLIDSLIFIGLLIPGGLQIGSYTFLLGTPLTILAFVYLFLADGLPRGRSLGKRVAGTAVVDAKTREPCGYLQSGGRNFAMILGLIDTICMVQRSRQRLGDMLAGTLVVRASS